jgi:type III secretion protein T
MPFWTLTCERGRAVPKAARDVPVSAATIVDTAPAIVVSAMLGMPRLLVFMIIVPLFPSNVFPRVLRTGVAIGLGAPVAVGVFHQLGPQVMPPDVVVLVLKECVLGLLIALPVAAPFWTMNAVGVLTDNQRGANAAQQVTPFAQADASELGAGLMQALVAMLAASGAYMLIYQLLLQSFQVWPVLQVVPDAAQFGFDFATARFDEFLYRTVLFAAPMLAIVLLVDFAFALTSVFAPQLQTYFASMPIKSLAAIGVLAMYVFVLLSHGEDYFLEVMRRESVLMESRSP